MLTREQILATKDSPKTELVNAFGGQVLVKQCSATVAHEMREQLASAKDNILAATVQWIIATAHNPETKEPYFTQEDASVIPQLAATEINTLAEAALRVNGVDKNKIEDAAKNS